MKQARLYLMESTQRPTHLDVLGNAFRVWRLGIQCKQFDRYSESCRLRIQLIGLSCSSKLFAGVWAEVEANETTGQWNP